jgi:ZIP family zinc transporter
MSEPAVAAIVAVAVGGSLLLGAAGALGLHLPESIAASVTAFGGGLLFSAVALDLVPEADERAGTSIVIAGLLAGTLLYIGADWLLTRSAQRADVRRAAQRAAAGRSMGLTRAQAEAARGQAIAVGLFVDGVPESVALGITIDEGRVALPLLIGVVVGNVVEAYGAGQPLVMAGRTPRSLLALLGGIGISLAGALVLGVTVLGALDDSVLGFLQALAGGAVLAVITVSVIPHAFSEVNRWVAVATVLGFVLGYSVS